MISGIVTRLSQIPEWGLYSGPVPPIGGLITRLERLPQLGLYSGAVPPHDPSLITRGYGFGVGFIIGLGI